jgi:glycosyltransferase involved in cell wall biosynthesis
LLKHRAGDTAIAVIPNVAPASPAGMTRPRMREGRRDILFVGNMGYLPNIDAAMWFATRIWPRLRPALPFPSRFVIAGNGAPREVVQLGRRPGIALAGPFEDAGRLYHRAALAVVPIRAGGGTRIKLLESAAHEVPIVATRIGAEGTGFRSGRELLLADNEQDFASSCARLLTDSKLASRLVAGARGKVRRDYAAARATKVLLDRIDPWFAKE